MGVPGDDDGKVVMVVERVAERFGRGGFGAFAVEDGAEGQLGRGGLAVAVVEVARQGVGFVGLEELLGVEVGVVVRLPIGRRS